MVVLPKVGPHMIPSLKIGQYMLKLQVRGGVRHRDFQVLVRDRCLLVKSTCCCPSQVGHGFDSGLSCCDHPLANMGPHEPSVLHRSQNHFADGRV